MCVLVFVACLYVFEEVHAQLEQVCLQSALEGGQSLCCSDQGRSFHHHGARTDSSPDREVEVRRVGGTRPTCSG